MGAMTKVMQKILEDRPEGTEDASVAAGSPLIAPPEPGLEHETASAFVGRGTGFKPVPQPPAVETPATAEWATAGVDPAVVAFHARYSAICEQYRAVRARLLAMNATRSRQVIAITSSIPEEGKSVSTLNLGLVMAEGGEHRVLVADGDFRRTSIARMLGIPDAPGLAEVLRGELSLEEALRPSPLPNLRILTAGTVSASAYGELLSSPATGVALSHCRALFDYTLLDTPPVTTVSDTCLLAPHCDGAIVVIEMRRTPEPTAQQAVRALQASNVKLLGCLLSRSRDRGTDYYAHYYSHYYR
jgi:capsular exopolysaccharide synthesis family protein